ncbi:deaminase [Streptomyces sp. MMS24-I31]|uniref:deaminase n=1 Tax=Streptomyces sp. MMS24-I31 TaxID=3351563 RepID=UPI003896EB6D
MSQKSNDRKLDRSEIGKLMASATRRPELVFALVPTLGADKEVVIQELEASLSSVGYNMNLVRLTDRLVSEFQAGEANRVTSKMDRADQVRELFKRSEAMALLAIQDIITRRGNSYGSTAWVLDSLAHPKEIEILRGVYGKRLFVIACDAPWNTRHEALTRKFRTRSRLSESQAAAQALSAMYRHTGAPIPESGSNGHHEQVVSEFRLAVGKALHEADVFVRTDDPNRTHTVVKRLVEAIFSHPYHTPNLDEIGMACAFQIRAKSASLSRQVGAAIMVDDQIVAVGCNEVPRAGGGTYDTESDPDAREWVEGVDPSDRFKSQILSDLLGRLAQEGFMADEQDITRKALDSKLITEAELFDIIEYARPAHAEMVAITAAARLGVKIGGGTLYTTTLPCHECTRNIIASGIKRVVYLEPYPKSRGEELYSDSIAMVVHHGSQTKKLSFEPFSGFSYRRFSDLFSWVTRKRDDLPERDGNRQYDGLCRIWKPKEDPVRGSILNPILDSAEILTQYFREWVVARSIPSTEGASRETDPNPLREVAEQVYASLGEEVPIYEPVSLNNDERVRFSELVRESLGPVAGK